MEQGIPNGAELAEELEEVFGSHAVAASSTLASPGGVGIGRGRANLRFFTNKALSIASWSAYSLLMAGMSEEGP